MPQAVEALSGPFQKEIFPQDIGPILGVHYTSFTTDGVALQKQETDAALGTLGARVFTFAADEPDADCPELDYQSEPVFSLRKAVTTDLYVPSREPALLERIVGLADRIEYKLADSIDRHGVRTVHVRNLTSLGYLNPPGTLAVYRQVVKRPDIHWVLHHHDLPWEGPAAATYRTSYPAVEAMIRQVSLPNRPNTSHIAISTIAAGELWRRFGIRADVIPDGFNFDRRVSEFTDGDFRGHFGFRSDDLLVGVMTRIRTNKDIEAAIEFAYYLGEHRQVLEGVPGGISTRHRNFGPDSRIFLVLPQSKDADERYFAKLQRYADAVGVGLAYIGDGIVSDADYHGQPDTFPFYSTYRHMDMIVYPPNHEGYGNQAVEAAWAKKLLVMHKYPVADADIWQHIPHLIPLGDNHDLIPLDGTGLHILPSEIVESAVQQAVILLRNPRLLRQYTEENYQAFRKLCDIRSVTGQYIDIYRRHPDSRSGGLLFTAHTDTDSDTL